MHYGVGTASPAIARPLIPTRQRYTNGGEDTAGKEAEENNELKKMPAMQEMQQQMEGIENKINVARHEYNNSVAPYNVAAKKNNAPQKDIAFKADTGSEKAPQVKF